MTTYIYLIDLSEITNKDTVKEDDPYIIHRARRDHDRMVDGFTTTYIQ